MIIIEPHIHMTSRTTDDYQRMYEAGIRACVEPSFWLGVNRTGPSSFIDSWRLSLDFETTRARRFGIDHYACVSVNPKEAEDTELARDVMEQMRKYVQHPRCVAIGEVGFNNITDNEEAVFREQLRMAAEEGCPVVVHLPHNDKPAGVNRMLPILEESGIAPEMVLLDHNTEETMPLVRETGHYLGLTVYPISKLTPQRVSGIVREFGHERVMVNGSADWGVSDPLSLPKVVDYMRQDGHAEETLRALVHDTADAFFSQSPKWQPELDLQPVDPREFQR
jgi:hypothetical protein